jgi:putative ABC transport system ATP-binding protein
MEPMINVKDVTKFYLKGRLRVEVLRQVNLQAERGAFLALIGASGSGKTTLLNLIGGIDAPSSGAIEVNAVRVDLLAERELAKWRTRHAAYVFQESNLLDVLTALENVELPLLLLHLGRRERKERAQAALDLVGLAARAAHYPRELSGGEEQRVAIARALVTDPDLVLLDEPTGNLDDATGKAVVDLLVKLNRGYGKTLIVATHDARLQREPSICVKYLRDGAVRDEGAS